MRLKINRSHRRQKSFRLRWKTRTKSDRAETTKQFKFYHGMNIGGNLLGEITRGILSERGYRVVSENLPGYTFEESNVYPYKPKPNPKIGDQSQIEETLMDLVHTVQIKGQHPEQPLVASGISKGGHRLLTQIAALTNADGYSEIDGHIIDAAILTNSAGPYGTYQPWDPRQLWENRHLAGFVPKVLTHGLFGRTWQLTDKQARKHVFNDPTREPEAVDREVEKVLFESGRTLFELGFTHTPANRHGARIVFRNPIARPIVMIGSKQDHIVSYESTRRQFAWLEQNCDHPDEFLRFITADTDHGFFGSRVERAVMAEALDFVESKIGKGQY